MKTKPLKETPYKVGDMVLTEEEELLLVLEIPENAWKSFAYFEVKAYSFHKGEPRMVELCTITEKVVD